GRPRLALSVLGLLAYTPPGATLAPPRPALERATSVALQGRSLGHLASQVIGVAPSAGNLVAAGLVAAGALAYCLADVRFRASPAHISSGIAVGLTVVAGWALTGLAYDDMAARPTPPVSLTSVRPVREALHYFRV